MNQITYRRQNEEIECIHYKNWNDDASTYLAELKDTILEQSENIYLNKHVIVRD